MRFQNVNFRGKIADFCPNVGLKLKASFVRTAQKRAIETRVWLLSFKA